MTLFGENSIFADNVSASAAMQLTVAFIVVSAVILIMQLTGLRFIELLHKLFRAVLKCVSKFIYKKEKTYHRDLEIGKLSDKRAKVKLYRFLSELIIDLNLLNSGILPYELLLLTCFASTVVTLILAKILFDSIFMGIMLTPIITIGVFCVMYTKANIAHDTRIEAVIEAENIICNNIKVGVVVAVRESLDVLPKTVRTDFKDFIDNIEQKNYHIKTALLELNSRLGSVADDFIKKCIVFEMEEEHGISGMFADIVEMNNIKMEMRTSMKRKFEEVKRDFEIGASMIFIFLGGVLAIYPNVRHFYFNKPLGQLIIAIDILLLIIEYVYITYLRAKEL